MGQETERSKTDQSAAAGTELEILNTIRAIVDGLDDLGTLREYRNRSEAVRKYLKVTKAGLEMQNRAAEIKLRVERRIGLILREISFGIALHPYSLPDVFVRGAGVRFAPLSREHQGPRAVLNAVHRLVSSLDQQLESTHLELTLARQQLSDYQHRVGSRFEQDESLTQLSNLRDRLKLALARKVEDGQDPHCVTSELARDIRTMLDSKVGSDAVMRPNSNATILAEEPVTMQLRRRLDLTQSGSPAPIGRNPKQEQDVDSHVLPEVENTSSANVPTPIDAPLPPHTFQESVQTSPKRQLQLF